MVSNGNIHWNIKGHINGNINDHMGGNARIVRILSDFMPCIFGFQWKYNEHLEIVWDTYGNRTMIGQFCEHMII